MVGDKKLYMDGLEIQSDFLKMFQYPLLQGNGNAAMQNAYSIVLTESTAKALFGSENAIGKTVRFDNKDDLTITGVLKDIRRTLRFSLISGSFQLLRANSTVGKGSTGRRVW
jgi:hypothetical protein